jgi:hypothetical protein
MLERDDRRAVRQLAAGIRTAEARGQKLRRGAPQVVGE